MRNCGATLRQTALEGFGGPGILCRSDVDNETRRERLHGPDECDHGRRCRIVAEGDRETPAGRGTEPGTTRRREAEPEASLKRERWRALRGTVTDNVEMPTQVDLMWPMLRALEELGGSASIGELDDRVATDMDLGEAVLDIVHGDGPQSEFAYRCAWARTRLRRIGAVDNSARGVWAITEAGRRIGSSDEALELVRRQRKEYRSGLRDTPAQPVEADDHAGQATTGD